MSENREFRYKLLIFGDGGVGKTSLATRYLSNIFKTDIKMTIGVDFASKEVELDNKRISLQIWDFGGEDRFRILLPGYTGGCSGGIFMYDITDPSSLKNFERWIPLFRNNTEPRVPILMVGGKLDLKENKAVDIKQVSNIAKKNNLKGPIECSAKTGENVEKIFITLAKLMMEYRGVL
ncbi:MAG: Rab family GTPase [Promethearchaeota archaeon]